MKFAYIDESGISVNERVLVVAGITIDADLQWMRVSEQLDQLVQEFVPIESRNHFVFHATDLFHRKNGPIPSHRAHDALKAIIRLPFEFGLGLSFGFFRKFRLKELPPDAHQKLRRKQASEEARLHHSICFCFCALGIERLMREDARENEIATLVVENNTQTEKDIKRAYHAMKGKNLDKPDERRIYDLLVKGEPNKLPLRRIIDVPHMVAKHEASILQIADACALIIRYCLEKRLDAKPFIDALSIGQPERIHNAGEFLEEDSPAGYNILTFRRS